MEPVSAAAGGNSSTWSTRAPPPQAVQVQSEAAVWVIWTCNVIVGPSLAALGLVGNAVFYRLIGAYAPGTSIAVLFRVLAISNSFAAAFAIVPTAVRTPL